MASKHGVYTEIDIVRHIVKDLIESYAQEKDTSKRFAPLGMTPKERSAEEQAVLTGQKKAVFKLYMRIWITCVRQVRNGCDRFEGRPVELRHIGHFFRAKDSACYTFIPNEELMLDGKLHLANIDSENQKTMPAEITEGSDGRVTLLNYHTIATICDCKADLVQTFLNRFRQVLLEMLGQKAATMLQINLRFGTLTIHKVSGEIEFKTAADSAGSLTQAKLASLGGGSHTNVGGEKSVSQISYYSRPALSQTKSTCESNLRSFQSLQQATHPGKGYIKAAYAPSQISASPSQFGNFNQRSASVKGDPFSTVQPLRANEAMRNMEQGGDGRKSQVSSLNHLQGFLKTQQEMYKSTIEKTRDTLSQLSNPIKNSHTYIQQIADLKKANADPETIKHQATKLSALNMDKWKLFHERAQRAQDKVAAEIHLPPKVLPPKPVAVKPPVEDKEPLQQENVAPPKEEEASPVEVAEAVSRNGDRYSQSMSVGGAMNMHKNILKSELSMVGSGVYQNVPAFLRSEGPFQVYNHHRNKGDEFHENAKLTKSAAKQRLQEQLDELRKKKEQDKKLFLEQIQTEEENFKIQQQLKRLQNIENQQFVKMQIDHRAVAKQSEVQEEKGSAKAHFGPEETEEVAVHMRLRAAEQQEKVRNAYLQQMQLSQMGRKLQRELELAQDSKNLETIIEMQSSEEQAKKLMQLQNQQKLRKAWLEQMEFRKIQKDYEKIFD